MTAIDLFLVSIYFHYIKMKQSGRNVIPWFATCGLMAISMPVTISIIIKMFLKDNFGGENFSETIFLIFFILFGTIIFFITKKYFFQNEKHIRTLNKYINNYSEKRRRNIFIKTLLIILGVPVAAIIILLFEYGII